MDSQFFIQDFSSGVFWLTWTYIKRLWLNKITSIAVKGENSGKMLGLYSKNTKSDGNVFYLIFQNEETSGHYFPFLRNIFDCTGESGIQDV